MRQIFLIAVLAILALAAVSILLLGAFPPHMTPQPVQVTLPNDHFQSH
jgi:hypothetical protein